MNKLSNIFSNDYLLLCIRLVIGLLLLFTGLEKIKDIPGFAESILNYRMLPQITINIFAISLAWIELFTGILILIGINTKESSIIVFTMVVIFTLGVFIALLRGLNIDCGCFGTVLAQKVGIMKILENLIALSLIWILIVNGAGRYVLNYKFN